MIPFGERAYGRGGGSAGIVKRVPEERRYVGDRERSDHARSGERSSDPQEQRRSRLEKYDRLLEMAERAKADMPSQAFSARPPREPLTQRGRTRRGVARSWRFETMPREVFVRQASRGRGGAQVARGGHAGERRAAQTAKAALHRRGNASPLTISR